MTNTVTFKAHDGRVQVWAKGLTMMEALTFVSKLSPALKRANSGVLTIDKE